MILGIDLGTSNSLVGVWQDGRAVIIPNALGDNLTPSVVGLADDGSMLIGKSARERLITHPHLTAATFKRYMGTQREVKLGNKSYRAEELSSFVLRALKADAEAFLGQPVTEAIITVPAYFNDTQRKATRAAGELAGLRVARLLNEPTAAALAYGLHEQHDDKKFLVFDLGGGTFDVSVLDMFDGVIEVSASTGDNFLGGEDFVDRIIHGFIRDVGKAAGLGESHWPPKLEQALRWEGERVKRLLTQQESARMQIQWEDKTLLWQITQDDFAKLCEPLLARLRTPLERALRDARIRASELGNIVLAGGTTRMPMIRRLVATLFGRLPASTLNPDEVVAYGAATQAGLKMRDGALEEVVLIDVCPYSLGVEVAERTSASTMAYGLFQPIIERNSVIPTSRENNFCTLSDFQKAIELNVYQGEARHVKDNVFLGKLTMKVPGKRAGEASVDVRFTYDVNGLLEIEAHVPLTKETKKLIIEENPGTLSADEIQQRLQKLQALKIHPRDQEANRALLARIDRLYEQSLGEERVFLNQRAVAFQHLLDKQNLSDIAGARKDLEKILDQIEHERYL